MQSEQFSNYIIVRTSYVWWRWWCQLYHCENKLRLMEMMMSAISLWEQVTSDGDDDVSYIIARTRSFVWWRWWWHLLCTRRTSKHVAPLGHIIQTQASRCFLLLLNDACLAGKQSIQIWYALVWPGWAPTGKHANHYTTNEKVAILNCWLAD
jgi:hypothetical protein